MKKLVLSLALILPMSAIADTVSFECVSMNFPGIHKFDAHGIVTVDDLNKVEGVITIITEKADSTHSAQTFDEVRVTGAIRHIAEGEISKYAFDHLALKTESDYLKKLNILMGVPTKIASRAFSVDNFVYRANCKIIDRLN